MSERLWLVRKSRFPFHALGDPLGTVVARDYDAADAVASTQFARPFTIEPAPREIQPATPANDVLEREIPMRRRPAVRATAAALPRTPRRFTGNRE